MQASEIGTVAKIVAASSRPMTDHVFIVFLLVFNATKDDHSPTKNSNPRQERHKHNIRTELKSTPTWRLPENRRVERGNQDQGIMGKIY